MNEFEKLDEFEKLVNQFSAWCAFDQDKGKSSARTRKLSARLLAMYAEEVEARKKAEDKLDYLVTELLIAGESDDNDRRAFAKTVLVGTRVQEPK